MGTFFSSSDNSVDKGVLLPYLYTQWHIQCVEHILNASVPPLGMAKTATNFHIYGSHDVHFNPFISNSAVGSFLDVKVIVIAVVMG